MSTLTSTNNLPKGMPYSKPMRNLTLPSYDDVSTPYTPGDGVDVLMSVDIALVVYGRPLTKKFAIMADGEAEGELDPTWLLTTGNLRTRIASTSHYYVCKSGTYS